MPQPMPQIDLAALAEQAVINGLRSPERIVRLRNALQIPKDTQVGPRVRPELVHVAADDPDEEVREAASLALALLADDDDAVRAVLRSAWTAPEPSRIARVLDWMRDRLIPMVPEPAAGGSATAWPFFRGLERGNPGPVARMQTDGDDVSVIMRQLPKALEGRHVEFLVPSLRQAGNAEAGWLRSEQVVDAGTVVVHVPCATSDARALGPIWVATGRSPRAPAPDGERESPLQHLADLVRERIGGSLAAAFHVRATGAAAAQGMRDAADSTAEGASTFPIDAGIDLKVTASGLEIVVHSAFLGPNENAHVITFDAASGVVIHDVPAGSGPQVVHLDGATLADLEARRLEVAVALVEGR